MELMLQYAIVLVNLDPTMGSDIKKTRPCVIISPNEMNKHLNTLIIAPITTSSKSYPTRVALQQTSLIGSIALDQIRTIDKIRIVKSLGTLVPNEILSIKKILKELLVD